MSVLGYSRSKRSYVGLRASAIALALVSARYPQPSRMTKTRGLGLAIFHVVLREFFHHRDTEARRRHREESIRAEKVFQTCGRLCGLRFSPYLLHGFNLPPAVEKYRYYGFANRLFCFPFR